MRCGTSREEGDRWGGGVRWGSGGTLRSRSLSSPVTLFPGKQFVYCVYPSVVGDGVCINWS